MLWKRGVTHMICHKNYTLFVTVEKDYMKKTRHEGDESTVAFWLYMKALYKDEE